jgi:ubiquinone/menaquinone biosynthesis C-methylase UbiE
LKEHVCPWWLGYVLVNPLRRFFHDPEKILHSYIGEGMTVLDIGCGMGFFSLPMARMVGSAGRVVCIDLQRKMIRGLVRRAEKADLLERIDPRICSVDHLSIEDRNGTVDFALVFASVHEVPNTERLLAEIYAALKQGGQILISEPKGHVTQEEFNRTTDRAQKAGFVIAGHPEIRRSHAVLLRKK